MRWFEAIGLFGFQTQLNLNTHMSKKKQQTEPLQIVIPVFGFPGCGKTTLINRIIKELGGSVDEDRFDSNRSKSVVVTCLEKKVEIVLEERDIVEAGSGHSYFRAKGCLFVFSCTEKSSLQCMPNIKSFSDRFVIESNYFIVTAGTMCDLEMQITNDELLEAERHFDDQFLVVSCETGEGIPELVEVLLEKVKAFSSSDKDKPKKEESNGCVLV